MITSSRSGLTVRRFLSGAILAALLCTPAAGEVLVFSFKGTITEKRTGDEGVSVFAGDIGDEFHGIFSYDTDAVDDDDSLHFGKYPLVEFTIDGTPLNVSNDDVFVGVLVILHYDLEVRGFHAPAVKGVDDGSTVIGFAAHQEFTDDSLPDSIDLEDFSFAVIGGSGSPSDRGTITEITLLAPRMLLESLIADVEYFVEGNRSKGLTAQLNAALGRLDRQNDIAACNILDAFNRAVAAQAGKHLDENLADYLISRARLVLLMLDCP